MELKNLYTLKAIIEKGSFGKAASKLGYTQSTITFQIKQLENELGVTLFEKIGRRMILTQEGARIMPYVDETLISLEKLQNVGKNLNDLTGELNIIMSESLLCYRTKEVITNFRRLAPNVRIKLRSMSCYATKQAIINGNADLGICYDEEENDERLSIHPLGHVPMAVVASPLIYQTIDKKDLDLTRKNVTLKTSFITDEPEGIFRRQFEKYIKNNNIILDNTIELWSIATIKNMVISNLGITYLPEFTVEEDLKKGDLISLSNNIPYENTRAIYVYHKNKYISRQMQVFINLIEKYMKF